MEKTFEIVYFLVAWLTFYNFQWSFLFTDTMAPRDNSTVDSLYLDYTLSRTSLYFEQKARFLGHLCTLYAIFISLSRTSLSRLFLYLEHKSWSLTTISLSISNFFPFKGPFTQHIEQKCLIFENSNVIKTSEIRKFDCNQNITKCKGFVLN